MPRGAGKRLEEGERALPAQTAVAAARRPGPELYPGAALLQGLEHVIADNSAWMPRVARESGSVLPFVFLVEGSSQTEQLLRGGESPSGAHARMATAGCPLCAPFANGVSAYGWSVVVLEPQLFVNLLRCLDG